VAASTREEVAVAAPTKEEVAAAAPTREEVAAAAPTREEVAVAAPPTKKWSRRGARAPSPAHAEESSIKTRTPPDAPDLGRDRWLLRPWWGGAYKARRPRMAPRMLW